MTVVDLADVAVVENSDVHGGVPRRSDGVLVSVTLFGRGRGWVLGTVTAILGQGWARTALGSADRRGDERGQQPARWAKKPINAHGESISPRRSR